MPLESKFIYINGVTGFIGRHFIKSCRYKNVFELDRFPLTTVPKIKQGSNIIFLAGMAHNKAKSNKEFHQINTEYPVSLAKIAKASGNCRFIYLSSANVYDKTIGRQPFVETHPTLAVDCYTKSKLVAEEQLLNLVDDTFEVVILRCPLVYGKHAPANFEKIKKISELTPFLPFGSAHLLRSYLSVGNLCSAIFAIVELPRIRSGIYNVCDNKPMSTRRLTTLIRQSNNKKVFQIPLPKSIMRFLGKYLGVSKQVDLLFESMVISNESFCETTGWSPEESPKSALYKLRKKL